MRTTTLCETWPQVLSRRQEWRPCSSPNRLRMQSLLIRMSYALILTRPLAYVLIRRQTLHLHSQIG
jgi:hypothetical protein